jgi:hypothetical protein
MRKERRKRMKLEDMKRRRKNMMNRENRRKL